MKKSVFLFITLLISGVAMAQNEACNFATAIDVLISPDVLTVTHASGTVVRFEGAQLQIDGTPRALNAMQQAAVLGLDRTVRAVIPELSLITTDSASVALEAVGLAADALLALDPDETAQLMQPLSELFSEIQSSITATYFNSSAINAELKTNFEQTVESTVAVLKKAHGAALLAKVLSGELSGEELQARMKALRGAIDARVAPKTLALERRAKTLCHQFKALKAFDRQLRSVSGYPNEGMINDA